VLKKICWYAVLTPSYSTAEGSSSDLATLVAATVGDKRLADSLPLYKQLLDTFQTPGAPRLAAPHRSGPSSSSLSPCCVLSCRRIPPSDQHPSHLRTPARPNQPFTPDPLPPRTPNRDHPLAPV